MSLQNSLGNPGKTLVLDASVVINLLATGYCERIIQSLPYTAVTVDVIKGELEKGRKRGRPDADHFDRIQEVGLVRTVSLDNCGLEVFENLVTGSTGSTLDDGEAATIAYATQSGGVVLVDERKARRICSEQFPEILVGCTIDVLASAYIASSLSPPEVRDAVTNALQIARMRVPSDYIEWVINLVGTDVASRCHSLRVTRRQAATTHGNQIGR